MIAEIELSLRRIIGAFVTQDELLSCIRNSLKDKYVEETQPSSLANMTFNDYVQIIGDGRNWPHFTTVFGQGEWQRKITTARLKEVGDLRNEVFHFRREITSHDLEILSARRDWLQMKARAFEARKIEKATAAEVQAETRTSEQPARRKWDEKSFFQELQRNCGVRDAATARKILEWAESNALSVWWGEGRQSGAFHLGLRLRGEWYHLIGVWTGGAVELQFEYMRNRPPFDSEANRLEFFRRLDAIPGMDLPDDAITRRPGVPMSVLGDEAVLEQFLEVLTWAAQQIKQA
jgi:hypothetical protein